MNYLQFDRQLLTDVEKNSIVDFVLTSKDSFVRHTHKLTGKPDENLAHIFTPEQAERYVGRLLSDLTVKPRRTGVLYMPPNGRMPWHIDDDKVNRRTCIMCPLHPSPENYAGTIFFDVESKKEVTCTYPNGYPLMANTQALHRMQNNSYERINLQISFHEDISTLIELHMQNKLFKST